MRESILKFTIISIIVAVNIIRQSIITFRIWRVMATLIINDKKHNSSY
jgi:hypothetical protein